MRQLWFLRRDILRPSPVIIPALAACMMLFGSLLPWLNNPLGTYFSAWNIPVDIGWQFHSAFLNYGLLCFCCVIFALLVTIANWKPFRGSDYFVQKQVTLGILCCIPAILFVIQYLYIDVSGISQLAQNKIQVLLIQRHYGYSAAADRITLKPFILTPATMQYRLLLLVNQSSVGLLLPCLSSWMLIGARRLVTPLPSSSASTFRWSRKNRQLLLLLCLLLCTLVLGRAPAASVCEYQARSALGAGDYVPALAWLNTALYLNPALNTVSYFHIERGQAEYFLHPEQQSEDSRAYLASVYQSQGDYFDAYQQLLPSWQSRQVPTWIVAEMSLTLEGLAEFTKPLNGPPVSRPDNDDSVLPWLQILVKIDPSNVYGHYLAGRIFCDLHNDSECLAQMQRTIHLSSNGDIQSSAYTYMALSEAGQGHEDEARKLLFTAVALDTAYRNNTAREELSGLR